MIICQACIRYCHQGHQLASKNWKRMAFGELDDEDETDNDKSIGHRCRCFHTYPDNHSSELTTQPVHDNENSVLISIHGNDNSQEGPLGGATSFEARRGFLFIISPTFQSFC